MKKNLHLPNYEIFTIDSVGLVGNASSIIIGADGLGRISYFNDTKDDLKVAHCNDLACSSAVTTTVDSAGNVGSDTSITIGTDGLPLISYYDSTNSSLKVAHCDDLTCSNATITTLDNSADVGQYSSIAIGTDGFGLISYHNATYYNLKVAHCDNQSCNSAMITTLDYSNDAGFYTAIAIGTDGFGLIGYLYDDDDNHLKVAHCNNLTCSNATFTTLDIGESGLYTAITIGTDGLGLISYWDALLPGLKVAHCDNPTCTTATSTTVDMDSNSNVGRFPSITIGSDDLVLISYSDWYNENLKVAHEVKPTIYLPLVLNNYCSGFAGPSEQEPNDASSQANGCLYSGFTYSGDPDRHGSGLDSDYYYFYTYSAGTITVDVTNFLAKGQVQLYYQTTGNLKKSVGDQPDGHYHITRHGEPGRYYIRVASPDGHPMGNGNYNLQVNYP